MAKEKLNLLAFFDAKEREKQRIEVVAPRVDYEREYEVSPIFPFSNTAEIVAGAEDVIDFAIVKPSSAKYLPFNTLQILNNSSVTIIVYINQNRDIPLRIPSGVIMPINSSIAPAISSLLIKNNDTASSISANEVQFLLSKDNVTTDKLAKSLHKLMLKGGA